MAACEKKSLLRYGTVRVADLQNDQETPATIAAEGPPGSSGIVTQEDLQQLLLSQLKQVIWDGAPGHWYLDFHSLGVFSLAELSAGAGSHRAVGIPLIGPTNGNNRSFTTPTKFVNLPAGETIEVFHNGHRLIQGVGDPRFADYFVSESGGVGTGFDTVNFLTFSPSSRSILVANYLPAP